MAKSVMPRKATATAKIVSPNIEPCGKKEEKKGKKRKKERKKG